MVTSVRSRPFADIPPTASGHFTLAFYAAVMRLLHGSVRSFGSWDDLFKLFPFLANYYNELAAYGLEGLSLNDATGWWRAAARDWETSIETHLPLRAVRDANGLDDEALTLLVLVGLIEEDARFGGLIETLNGGGQTRPTVGLLTSWWCGEGDWGEARTTIRELHALGLVAVVDPDVPRSQWALRVPGVLWDALRGERGDHLASDLRHRPVEQLDRLDDLILPDAVREQLLALPSLLEAGEAGAVVVRGPRGNGRRTLLGAVARQLGRGLLEARGSRGASDERARLLGPLATALGALPVVVLDLGPGESVELPRLSGYHGPLGVVLGQTGGINGAGLERALTLTLPMPDAAGRLRHWERAIAGRSIEGLPQIAERFRLTGGNIRRAAGMARAYSALAGRPAVTPADVQAASRALNRQTLEVLAEKVEVSGDWGQLVVGPDTARELRTLESRCRNRERLGAAVGPAMAGIGPGVRALLSGPSGTGKTLAARILAAVLQMDLYRVDLSAVVNKYIGETEKNLNQLFARAEELDVILLLDEGDALLTGRTSVQTANDRYANLETNYLLQRLESFSGILLVTTNAGERIDGAFQRRLDVVVTFGVPGVAERWTIWQLHLPPGHAVPRAGLDEVARRCELRGGQIRNAALHAALLAIDDGGTIGWSHLEAAVQREYRKIGAVCPLFRAAPSVAGG